jgi:hypothetical protein
MADWTEEELNKIHTICKKYESITDAKKELLASFPERNWNMVGRRARYLRDEGKLEFSTSLNATTSISEELLDKIAILELLFPGCTKELDNVPVTQKAEQFKASITKLTGFEFSFSQPLKPAHVVGLLLHRLASLPGNSHEMTNESVQALGNNFKFYEAYAKDTIRKLAAVLPLDKQQAILNALD